MKNISSRPLSNLRFPKPLTGRNVFLKKLSPVIKHWQKSIIEYCNAHPDDAPFAYNERANISLLAAGAWKCGAIALEEYTASKRRHRKIKYCRCDLYILVDGKDAQVEAKQWWLRGEPNDFFLDKSEWVAKNKNYRKKIKKAFSSALKAARANTESDLRLGCVFFPIGFSAEKFDRYEDNPKKYIRSVIEHMIACEADLWTWCFPEQTRTYFYKSKKGKKTYWPGIILGMKILKA